MTEKWLNCCLPKQVQRKQTPKVINDQRANLADFYFSKGLYDCWDFWGTFQINSDLDFLTNKSQTAQICSTPQSLMRRRPPGLRARPFPVHTFRTYDHLPVMKRILKWTIEYQQQQQHHKLQMSAWDERVLNIAHFYVIFTLLSLGLVIGVCLKNWLSLCVFRIFNLFTSGSYSDQFYTQGRDELTKPFLRVTFESMQDFRFWFWKPAPLCLCL